MEIFGNQRLPIRSNTPSCQPPDFKSGTGYQSRLLLRGLELDLPLAELGRWIALLAPPPDRCLSQGRYRSVLPWERGFRLRVRVLPPSPATLGPLSAPRAGWTVTELTYDA